MLRFWAVSRNKNVNLRHDFQSSSRPRRLSRFLGVLHAKEALRALDSNSKILLFSAVINKIVYCLYDNLRTIRFDACSWLSHRSSDCIENQSSIPDVDVR